MSKTTNALNAAALQATGVLAVMMAPTITKADIDEVETALTEYATASAARNKAEKRKDKALSLVFEKALGVDGYDATKKMTEAQINQQLLERIKTGLVNIECPFEVKETHCTTTVAYKAELTAAKGQAYVMGLVGVESRTFAVVALPVPEPPAKKKK